LPEGRSSSITRLTILDVAAKAGVSAGTVSAVLNKTSFVSEALTQSVLQAVEELGYQPNALARGLRRQSTETIGVIFPSILTPFYSLILREIDSVLSGEGYSIIFAHSKEDIKNEANLISLMTEKRVDGLLIASAFSENIPAMVRLTKRNVPVVAFHYGLAAGQIDTVVWDDFSGCQSATRHIIQGGRRRIAIVGWFRPSHLPRLLGYQSALKEAGLEIDPSLQLDAYSEEETRTGHGPGHPIHNAIERTNPADGMLVMASGYAVLNVLVEIKALGVRVPEDLSIVVYDDYVWMEHVTPPLSAVARNSAEMGARAAQLLLDRISEGKAEQPETILLPTTLVVRQSSVPL
jgi:DNA-binding LacI/PurR family transcriptional regulator